MHFVSLCCLYLLLTSGLNDSNGFLWLCLRTLEFFRYRNVVFRLVTQKPVLNFTLNSAVFLLVFLIRWMTLGRPSKDWVCFASQGNLTSGRNRWEGAYFRVNWNSCPFPLWVMGSDSALWQEKIFCIVLKGWDGRNNSNSGFLLLHSFWLRFLNFPAVSWFVS